MVAMNGPSPSRVAAAAMPGVVADSTFTSNEQPDVYAADTATPVAFAPGDSGLPAYGPISPERPELGVFPEQNQQVAMEVLGYADRRVKAAAAFAAFDDAGARAEDIAASWKQQNPADGADGDASYVAAGTFSDRIEADRIAAVLAKSGRVSVDKSSDAEGVWYSVEVRSDGRRSLDDILEAAWMNGASDAMTVRE
jgi:rare lipoprotein A